MREQVRIVSTKKTLGFALLGMLLGMAVFSGMPNLADAARLTGATIAPNWALGSPQPVFIRGCSDADLFGLACFGHFGLGRLSDVLDINLLGRPVGTEASLSENARLFVGGLLEAGNEQLNDWWDLWIPNARWVAFGPNAGIGYLLSDPGDVRPGDAIAYVNINNAAHILWASNNSDEDTATLPPDFTDQLTVLAVSPSSVNTRNDGSFDNTTVPIPTGGAADCTTDPACTPTSAFGAVPTFDPVPEPSTWLMFGTGLLGLFGYGWRRRKQGA